MNQPTLPADLRRLCCGFWPGVNVYLIEEPDGVTVVDTGYFWNGPGLVRAIRAPVKRILLTHFHPDHSGGAAVLARATGAAVHVHSADLPFVTGARRIYQEPGWWFTRHCLGALRLLNLDRTTPPPRVVPFEEGDRFGRWQVLHTPGHTPGSSSFWHAESGVLFCGDNLVNQPWGLRVGVPWWTLDHALQRRSIQRYEDLDVRLLLSGHGPPYAVDGRPWLPRRR